MHSNNRTKNDNETQPTPSPIVVPWNGLELGTLGAVVEEYILREGTDYGFQEIPLDQKVKEIKNLLKSGKAEIVFDPETETCTIHPK